MNYQAQAEKIAVEAFLNFDDVTKEKFFTFFQEVYAEKREVYRFFYTQYADLRVGKMLLSKHQKKQLLAVILPFISTEQQFYLFQCEVLQQIHAQKQYLTYRGKYPVPVPELIRILNQYQKYIENLPKSSWFHLKSYQEIDRKEVLDMMRYVCLRKLNNNVSMLKKDCLILRENKKNLPAQVGYFFDFLDLHIDIEMEKIEPLQLPDQNTHLAYPTPAPVGKFKTVLENYLFEELNQIEEEKQKKETLQTLFTQDLPTTLAHYKNSTLRTNQVTALINLEAGAGKLYTRLKTESTIIKVFYLTLSAIGLASFVSLFLFGISLKGVITLASWVFIWLFILLLRAGKGIYDTSKNKKGKQKEIKEIYTEKYKEIIENRKEELDYIFVRDNILDKIKDAFYWKIKNKKIQIYANDIYMNPRDILNAYRAYAQYIISIKPQEIDILYALEGSIERKNICFEMMKYLCMKKLKKSYKSFLNLANLMIHHTLIFDYYMYFIDTPCEMLKGGVMGGGFYDTESSNLYEYENIKHKIERRVEFEYDYPIDLEADPELWAWFKEEEKQIQKNNLEQEYQYLDKFIKNKNAQFIIEGEEGVLFYSCF